MSELTRIVGPLTVRGCFSSLSLKEASDYGKNITRFYLAESTRADPTAKHDMEIIELSTMTVGRYVSVFSAIIVVASTFWIIIVRDFKPTVSTLVKDVFVCHALGAVALLTVLFVVSRGSLPDSIVVARNFTSDDRIYVAIVASWFFLSAMFAAL